MTANPERDEGVKEEAKAKRERSNTPQRYGKIYFIFVIVAMIRCCYPILSFLLFYHVSLISVCLKRRDDGEVKEQAEAKL